MLLSAAAAGALDERLSAFNAGIGVAGVAVHFNAWPWSLHGGLPMLDEAEGLSEDQLPAYNAVLWFWLHRQRPQPARETGRGSRRFGRRRPAQLPDPARLGPPPLPAGRASRRSCEPERWSPALRE